MAKKEPKRASCNGFFYGTSRINQIFIILEKILENKKILDTLEYAMDKL